MSEKCHCQNFEREESGNWLCFICTCGHTQDEHAKGMLTVCEAEDDGGDEE